MKNTYRSILIVVALAVFNVSTVTVQAGDFMYVTNNGGTITITRYTGPGFDVDIPNTINGLPVTSIGHWAFSGCTSLKAVYFGGNALTQNGYGFLPPPLGRFYYLPGTTGWGPIFGGVQPRYGCVLTPSS